jgi:tetratricopeptide (TPR) repeat protein
MEDNRNNKVLSFNQPAEFFIKKAEKHIDAGNFLEALALYRCVLGMEPENVDYLLSIAQIYSEMGLYAESNDVLLKIAKYGNTPTECLFALGCNYMGLKNYELADEAFEQYLAIDPEGEYAEDIDELFDIMDEEDYEEDGALHDISRRLMYEEAFEGKLCLDKGDYKNAIKHLEKVVQRDEMMHSAMNNLALSYFFDGRKSEAIELSKRVLNSQPLNLHACCNLALFYSDMNDHANAAVSLDKLNSMNDIEPEDMHKVALTYCELGYHQKAYHMFQKIVMFQPYDIRILHFCGLAAYNCGQYAESLSYFVKILKIDPDNSLAQYYKTRAEDAKRNGSRKELEYVYQVQFDEIKRRISYLNECLKQKDGSLKDKWENDAFFKSIIFWGLHYGDEYIKKIVLEIMSMFSDTRVEEAFRDFLLKSSETDDIKNDIFMYLKKMGAKEPYVAYIKGAIAEVRVGTVSEDLKSLPQRYADALSSFIGHARPRYNDEFVALGVELMLNIVKGRKDDGKWIKTPDAFAAALELYVCETTEDIQPPSKRELSEVYSISVPTLNRYFAELFMK